MNPAHTLRRIASAATIKLGVRSPILRGIVSRMCVEQGAIVEFADDWLDLIKGDHVIRLGIRHLIYAPSIAENFAVYFEPVAPEKVGDRLIVDFSKPKRHRYLRRNLEFELSSFPEEDEIIEEYFHWYTPQPGDLVFDFGAHCGLSTYYLSKAVGATGSVIAFEPDDSTFPILLKNRELHHLSNVTPVQAAISDSNGTATFYSEGTIGSVLKSVSNRPTVGDARQVETITIQSACERWGLPAFIKMDIEGAEVLALTAARDFLTSHAIAFVVDTNHPTDGMMTDKAVEEIFRRCGYTAESILTNGIVTTFAKKKL